ncbi:MAG: hypothetical protein E6550_01355 [Veillonella sp.]|jgi:hypothetical protein|uniref:hypothetical protein n=1 Tax=Veillonella sp. TaxID=1926307 RepID=UPI002672E36E|nr:hypothetical protein [Veillonella sp.]MDU3237282.1 hypothetical protein [Veillonella sp.]MDU6397294.1 hypothetical protein [Veillonella sp.]
MKLGLSLFLLCLYSLYFIRNPYFVLGKEQVKRSKSMLYTEIGIGCLVFILINVPYNGDNLIHLLAVIGILNWGLELYLRILAVKGDSSLSLEHKPMLIKKAKKDFYSVIPILVILALIIVFNVIN